MLLLKFGGDEGDRTPYLLNAIQALSQVSYTPTGTKHIFSLIVLPSRDFFIIIASFVPSVNPVFLLFLVHFSAHGFSFSASA